MGSIDTVGTTAAPGISDNGHSHLPVKVHPDKCGEARAGWNGFSEVYMMSALTGDGIDSLKVRGVVRLWGEHAGACLSVDPRVDAGEGVQLSG